MTARVPGAQPDHSRRRHLGRQPLLHHPALQALPQQRGHCAALLRAVHLGADRQVRRCARPSLTLYPILLTTTGRAPWSRPLSAAHSGCPRGVLRGHLTAVPGLPCSGESSARPTCQDLRRLTQRASAPAVLVWPLLGGSTGVGQAEPQRRGGADRALRPACAASRARDSGSGRTCRSSTLITPYTLPWRFGPRAASRARGSGSARTCRSSTWRSAATGTCSPSSSARRAACSRRRAACAAVPVRTLARPRPLAAALRIMPGLIFTHLHCRCRGPSPCRAAAGSTRSLGAPVNPAACAAPPTPGRRALRQGPDLAFYRDFQSYMKNEDPAYNGNLLGHVRPVTQHLFWCALLLPCAAPPAPMSAPHCWSGDATLREPQPHRAGGGG